MISLVLPIGATTAVILCTIVAYQLRFDRLDQSNPRHRPTPARLPPRATTPKPEPKPPFDPLTSPLDDVERFLAELQDSADEMTVKLLIGGELISDLGPVQ